jgi:hypothetical protein
MSFVLAAKPASASLLDGQTVQVQYAAANDIGYTPLNDFGGYNVFGYYGTAVAPTGGAFNSLYAGVFMLVVNDTTISITNTNAGTSFSGSPYQQGLLVTLLDPNAPTITGVTYDGSSTLGNAGDVAFNSHQIFFNVNDEAFVTGTAVLDIAGTSAAPEPGTLAMGVGGILLALMTARRARKA